MELTIHPLAKQLPEWPVDDGRFMALTEDIRERGLDRPLLIDREERIVDGRMCWRAVKRLQLPQVECKVVLDEQIAGTIVNSLVQRRHLTKGQLAYVSFPILAPAYEERRRNRVANLRKGQQSPDADSIGIGKTVESFYVQLGISRDTFDQCVRIHDAFKNPKKFEWLDERRPLTLREYYEPRIMDPHESAGLGAVLAGIGAKFSQKTTDQRASGQLELFRDGLLKFKARWNYWLKFNDSERKEARAAIRTTVLDMPLDLRGEWSAALKEAR